jgi:hypothetical protein
LKKIPIHSQASGTYFIRPILQEYKFNSSSFTVHIDEGLTQELILEANRFAYRFDIIIVEGKEIE